MPTTPFYRVRIQIERVDPALQTVQPIAGLNTTVGARFATESEAIAFGTNLHYERIAIQPDDPETVTIDTGTLTTLVDWLRDHTGPADGIHAALVEAYATLQQGRVQ